MLRVRIGYYDFIFSDEQCGDAYSFAKTARDHFSEEDKNREVSITFFNDEEEEVK